MIQEKMKRIIKEYYYILSIESQMCDYKSKICRNVNKDLRIINRMEG